jgi:hypothetical protein
MLPTILKIWVPPGLSNQYCFILFYFMRLRKFAKRGHYLEAEKLLNSIESPDVYVYSSVIAGNEGFLSYFFNFIF